MVRSTTDDEELAMMIRHLLMDRRYADRMRSLLSKGLQQRRSAAARQRGSAMLFPLVEVDLRRRRAEAQQRISFTDWLHGQL
jgi:hypothetical protein